MIKSIKIKTYLKKNGYMVLSVLFWLLVWEGVSLLVGEKILLPSPITVCITLIQLCQTAEFWEAVAFTSLRIALGFLLSLTLGVALAVCSYNSKILRVLLSPLVKVIKSMPIASLIILALIWIKARNLTVIISFLMVLPIIYTNVLQGLISADEKLLQMAKVYRIGKLKKIRAIYIPSVVPYFISAVSVGIGFCWKAGIAAEVIGIPVGSIGEQIYEAKLYLMTKELFAWTIVIIGISVIFENILLSAIHHVHPKDDLSVQDEHK